MESRIEMNMRAEVLTFFQIFWGKVLYWHVNISMGFVFFVLFCFPILIMFWTLSSQIFNTVSKNDTGEYFCVASNGIGLPQKCSMKRMQVGMYQTKRGQKPVLHLSWFNCVIQSRNYYWMIAFYLIMVLWGRTIFIY